MIINVMLISIFLCLSACTSGGSSTHGSSHETTTPIIASVEPQNNSISDTLPKNIVVTFNEAMDPDTITVNTFFVTLNSESVNGAVTYNSANKTATFIPSTNLKTTATYTCTITTGVKTLSGNSLQIDYIWKFSNDTAPLSPTISQSAHGNNVTIDWAEVEGTYSYNIYWSEHSPFSTSGLTFPNKIMNVGPLTYTHNNLLSGKTYYYAMTAVNTKGESNYSNVVNSKLDASNGPAIISTFPSANEAEVPVSDLGNWTPNKLMLRASYNMPIATPTVSVVDGNNNPVEITSYNSNDPAVILYNFTEDLQYNTTYTVTASEKVTGNTYSWKFTTVETAPVISYTITPPYRLDISWTPVKGATSYNFVYFWLDSIFDTRASIQTGLTQPFWLTKPIITAEHTVFYYWIVAVKGTQPISVSNSIHMTGIP